MSVKKKVAGLESSDGQPDDSLDKKSAPQYSLKRMIFVASMYFWMIGINHPTKDQLNEVNKRFDLANGSGALLFPAAISKLMWGKVDFKDMLQRYQANKNVLTNLSKEVLAQAPEWAKYGDGRSIERDIKAVFDSVQVS